MIIRIGFQRGSKGKARVVNSRRNTQLQKLVRDSVGTGSSVYNDALLFFEGLSVDLAHRVIDQAEAYGNGDVEKHNCENLLASA